LVWGLENKSGVYTSEDIRAAIEIGYKVNFIGRCLVYDESSNAQESPFRNYIDKFFILKNRATVSKNKVQRSIAKLMMNSLYGKMLQKACDDNVQIFKNHKGLLKWLCDYDLKDWIIIDEDTIMVTGTAKDKEEPISKPAQLGAFILAYTRTLAMKFYSACDESLKSVIFSYCDTDSMHITGDLHKKLVGLDLIRNSELGYLTNDVDNNGLILREINIGPKNYMYEYINDKGEYNTVMKCKGINKKLLESSMYERAFNGEKVKDKDTVQWDGLKRVHKTVNKKQAALGIGHFSIINQHYTREFAKNKWGGMKLTSDGIYLPHGYNK
jgi:DNA polymerase type B, organellar and viral